MFDYKARQTALRLGMQSSQVDAYFCPLSSDLEYLTGIPRRVSGYGNVAFEHDWASGALFRLDADPLIILPAFVANVEMVSSSIVNVVLQESDDPVRIIAEAVRPQRIRRLAVSQRTWAQTIVNLAKALSDPELLDGTHLTERLRSIKSAEEVDAMSRACQIVDETMAAVVKTIRVGITELELLHEIQFQMQLRGSIAPSFETAVFSMGPDDTHEPYVRSTEPLRQGTAVSFDFGAVVEGYCSDFGRTVFIGDPSAEARRIHDLVVAAQTASLSIARPGVSASEVDAEARRLIAQAGFERMFHSRVGHSIGLDTHERPYLAPTDRTCLAPGMTFTIEPSIYWSGHTGVRIEDVVVCEAQAARRLNHYPSQLIVV